MLSNIFKGLFIALFIFVVHSSLGEDRNEPTSARTNDDVCITKKPLKSPPSELLQNYTMQGRIPIEYFYVDDTNNGLETHFIYLPSEMERYISGARRSLNNFQRINIRPSISLLNDTTIDLTLSIIQKNQRILYILYLLTDIVHNSNVAVYGSMEPWVESFLLALGAKTIVTIEYNNLTYPLITTISKSEFPALYGPDSPYLEYFDLIVSPSAFDHDGLGRYGDPLNPDADLLAMKNAAKLLKPTGILLLTVPIGPDVVVFNLHRRYGIERLPLLLDAWEVMAKFGFEESKLTATADWRQTYEPIYLLKKQTTN